MATGKKLVMKLEAEEMRSKIDQTQKAESKNKKLASKIYAYTSWGCLFV